MKGGAGSTLTIDRAMEVTIASQHSQQAWMRSIGFVNDGVIKFTANRLALTGRTPDSQVEYEATDNGFITVEARVKGGIDGFTQSLACQTDENAPVLGGTLNEESVNFKNIARFYLASDLERLPLRDYYYDGPTPDAYKEPEKYRPRTGNLSKNDNPLFVDAPKGDYRLTEESPLIDAGDSRRYTEVLNTYLFTGQKDMSGHTRIIGDAIDIGAFEYDPNETGNEHPVHIVDGITVWTQQGKLYLRSEKPVMINVYAVSGIMVTKLALKAGETGALPLDRGIYMVVPDNNGHSRKVFVW
jgi:hypothetical protein